MLIQNKPVLPLDPIMIASYHQLFGGIYGTKIDDLMYYIELTADKNVFTGLGAKLRISSYSSCKYLSFAKRYKSISGLDYYIVTDMLVYTKPTLDEAYERIGNFLTHRKLYNEIPILEERYQYYLNKLQCQLNEDQQDILSVTAG